MRADEVRVGDIMCHSWPYRKPTQPAGHHWGHVKKITKLETCLLFDLGLFSTARHPAEGVAVRREP